MPFLSATALRADEHIATLSPLDIASFKESFDSFSPTSTKSIVGLTIGTDEGAFNPDAFFMVLPAVDKANGEVICVQTITQDARFSAENPYLRVSRSLPVTSRLSPVTRDFTNQLSAYDQSEIAIRAALSDDNTCKDGGTVFIPRVGGDNTSTLEIRLNARGQDATASFTNLSGQKISVDDLCSSPSDAALIAYDRVCKLKLADQMRDTIADLRIIMDDGFSEYVFEASVYIPPAELLP
tara:strand:- start:169020 stop:169736 length:717 start_codon:yes stop_codon:yes gene_type:complete